MTVLRHAFGPFQFDADKLILLRDGVPVALGGRAGAILAALLAARGQIVRKGVLIDAAWPDTAIEESNLSVQISKLRRVIGDERIRTVERIGYQFVADAPSNAFISRTTSVFPTLALLNSDADGVSAGLVAELSAALARFKTLRVFVVTGPDSGADYVAALSCRRGNGAQRSVTIRLADGQSGVTLWAHHFEAGADEVMAGRMASAIESEVHAAETTHGGRTHAAGSEAYALYLRGRRILNSSRETDNRVAFGLFMAAVRLEPENSAYLAAATEAMHHRISVGWESLGLDDKQVCHELAYRTLAVAGSDAVAVALAGNALFTADEEDMGLTLCRRALAMNPTSQLVLACALHAEWWGGSTEQSEAVSRTAAELAPNDPGQRFALGGLATIASWRGDYATAVELGRRSLAFGPGYIGGHHSVIEGLIGLGRREQAERQMVRYLAVAPGVTIERLERGQHMGDPSRLAPRLESLRRAGMPER